MNGRLTSLTLVAREPVIEVLGRRWLIPLRVGRLLAATISASTRGTSVSHRLRAISSRRLRLGTSVVRLLPWAV